MRSILALILAVPSFFGTTARAQPTSDVDAARRAYENAEFRGALAILRDIEERSTLDLAGYVRVLEMRAFAHRALGHEQETDRALTALASIAPDHRFGPEAPPELIERFAAHRRSLHGRVRVAADTSPAPSGIRVVARAENDLALLVREVRVHVRVDGGPWQRGVGSLTVPARAGSTVAFYAEAIGPAHVVLARLGTAATPRLATVRGEPDDAAQASFPWIWVGVGGAVILAAAVLVIATAGSSDDTQVGVHVDW